MADVDMDVDPPATKGKKDGKDTGKPRFEVKKVQSCYLERPPQFLVWFTSMATVERCVFMGVGYDTIAPILIVNQEGANLFHSRHRRW